MKSWLTKLRSIESFLLATVDEPATQSPSTQAHIDYEQLGPSELSDHCVASISSQKGPRVTLDRGVVIKMCGYMVSYTDHSMNDVASLAASHLSALDRIQCSLNQLSNDTTQLKAQVDLI